MDGDAEPQSELTGAGPDEWLSQMFSSLEWPVYQYLEAVRARSKVSDGVSDNGASTAAEATQKAALVLYVLTDNFRKIPLFTNHPVVIVLVDIANSLVYRSEGGNPLLLRQGNISPSVANGFEQSALEAEAVLCVRYLQQSGHCKNEKEAREQVARIWSRVGHKGRKGGPLSAATLRDWCQEIDGPRPDTWGQSIVKTRLDGIKADPNWPGTRKQALAWVARHANKYG